MTAARWANPSHPWESGAAHLGALQSDYNISQAVLRMLAEPGIALSMASRVPAPFSSRPRHSSRWRVRRNAASFLRTRTKGNLRAKPPALDLQSGEIE